MHIRITIETTEPLTGTAAASGVASQRFKGWLELLSALSALVDATARQPGSGGEELEHGGAGGNGAGHG
jgi:hypothetical protein